MASPPSAVKPYTAAKESHDELDAMEHFLETLQPGEDDEDHEPMLKRLFLTPEPPSVREIEMAHDMRQQQRQIAMLLQQVAELTAVKRGKDTETKPKTQTETQKETQKEIQTEIQKQLHVTLHVDSETKHSHQFKNVQEQIREGFDLDEKPKPLRLITSIGAAHKQPLLPTGRQAIRNELTGINHMS
jgi:polyribonucleotide nucleotidyltransferase